MVIQAVESTILRTTLGMDEDSEISALRVEAEV